VSLPQDTAGDCAGRRAAKQEAQHAVEQARIEATKDVKSALKTGGGNPRDVALAKATAAYDVAMIKAEGDHQVATQKCQTLQASMMQACKDQADAEYETAKAAAKARGRRASSSAASAAHPRGGATRLRATPRLPQ